MHQQAPVAPRLVVVAIALLIGRNVGAQQQQLAVLDRRIGIRQRNTRRPTGLHFGASQLYAGLKVLQNGEVMTGFFILYDVFHVGLATAEIAAP